MNLARLHVCLPTYVNSDLLKESFKKEKLRELSIKTKKYGNRDQWKENHSTENSRKFQKIQEESQMGQIFPERNFDILCKVILFSGNWKMLFNFSQDIFGNSI